MKIKKLKAGALFVIFLLTLTIPLNCVNAQEQQKNMGTDALNEVLDMPVNQSRSNSASEAPVNTLSTIVNELSVPNSVPEEGTNESNDIITTHIVNLAPDVTTGELLKIRDMMDDQWNTENGDFKLRFYEAWINNSTEIIASGRTAQELYNIGNNGGSKYYKDIIDNIERIILNYNHMTRGEKVDFLQYKDPQLVDVIRMFDTTDINKKTYLSQFLNKEEFPDASDVGIFGINDYQNKVGVWKTKFLNNMYTADTTYDISKIDNVEIIINGVNASDERNHSIEVLNSNLGILEDVRHTTTNALIGMGVGAGVSGIFAAVLAPSACTVTTVVSAVAGAVPGVSAITQPAPRPTHPVIVPVVKDGVVTSYEVYYDAKALGGEFRVDFREFRVSDYLDGDACHADALAFCDRQVDIYNHDLVKAGNIESEAGNTELADNSLNQASKAKIIISRIIAVICLVMFIVLSALVIAMTILLFRVLKPTISTLEDVRDMLWNVNPT
ncbi:MAG: hypothetical protein LBT10_04260 [Methanobrevibacter sp.]|jgi:hypothetical protein|nr:hypothetical protein [Methanobrevibacter sp.]